ncbi:MAG: ASCH domain-containing protein [Candidatus Nezhaarchaeales archaeon]
MRKKRVIFLGRHIMMKKDFAELVLAGIKTATIRLGIVKPKKKKESELLIREGASIRAIYHHIREAPFLRDLS